MSRSSATTALSRALPGIAKDLDQAIAAVAGKRVAFTLVIFTDLRAQYISSASREDSVRELRNLLAHFDQGGPDVPAHEVN